MTSSLAGPLLNIFAIGFILATSYWVIRLAVRHAIKDADERRGRLS